MSCICPKDTLAYHQARPLTSHLDKSQTRIADFSVNVKLWLSAPKVTPEAEALWFYGLNHGMALLQAERAPLEPLSDKERDYVNAYHAVCGPAAVRAFYYLLLICTREARHCNNMPKLVPQLKAKFGTTVADFFSGVKGNEGTIQVHLLGHSGDLRLGPYTQSLAWLFYKGSWNGGFGGKAWGKVTDCLVRFVTGEFTAEMMLDTIWTLAHNNGPIFNKGMIYNHYDLVNLLRILDVQRSGQIPTAILTDKAIKAYTDKGLVSVMQGLAARYPDKISTTGVDWKLVQSLGAVGTYVTLTKEEVAAKMAAEAAAAAELEKTKFYLTPTVFVTKVKRKAA